MGIFYAVLQMLCCGQNCKFCHIESCGKNTVTNLIKLQSTSFFLHMEPVYIHSHQPVSFQTNFQDLTNGNLVTFDSLCIVISKKDS